VKPLSLLLCLLAADPDRLRGLANALANVDPATTGAPPAFIRQYLWGYSLAALGLGEPPLRPVYDWLGEARS
jgi:hypothetical protein